MDGTLLDQHHRINDETAAAIRRLQAETDVEFLIVTGRDFRSAHELLKAQQLDLPIIGLNGGANYDRKGNLLHFYSISDETVQAILTYCQERQLILTLKAPSGFYVSNYEAYRDRLATHLYKIDTGVSEDTMAQFTAHVNSLQPLAAYRSLDNPTLKLMIIDPSADVLQKTREFLSQFSDIDTTSSGHDNLEITSHHAQKGLAIQSYIQEKGIEPDEVLTIGDSLNDYSMLAMFKNSYAMANGRDEVKAVASHIAPPNSENGVAQVIEQVIAAQRG